MFLNERGDVNILAANRPVTAPEDVTAPKELTAQPNGQGSDVLVAEFD